MNIFMKFMIGLKKNKIDFKTSPVEKFGYAEKNTKILIDVNSLVETMTNVYRY